MFVVSVGPGQEVVQSISRALAGRGIADAAIVSLIGAVDGCVISNMPADDALSDILTELKQPLELSGNGAVKNGRPHLHCVVSGEGNGAVAGHLH